MKIGDLGNPNLFAKGIGEEFFNQKLKPKLKVILWALFVLLVEVITSLANFTKIGGFRNHH